MKHITKTDNTGKFQVLYKIDVFVLESEKVMHKLKHELPKKFQELFKLNHTVYTIQTRNKDEFYCKYYSKGSVWRSGPDPISNSLYWRSGCHNLSGLLYLSTFCPNQLTLTVLNVEKGLQPLQLKKNLT